MKFFDFASIMVAPKTGYEYYRETEFIKTFVVKQKQERYFFFVQSPKRRPRFLRELYHFSDFNPAYVVPLSGAAWHVCGE